MYCDIIDETNDIFSMTVLLKWKQHCFYIYIYILLYQSIRDDNEDSFIMLSGSSLFLRGFIVAVWTLLGYGTSET